MTITIPAWLLWAAGILIGIPAALFVLACTWFGFVVAWNWKWRGW